MVIYIESATLSNLIFILMCADAKSWGALKQIFMKNQWQIWSVALLLLMGLSFTACEKEDVEEPTTESSYSIQFHHKVGTADFVPGDTYNINGKLLRLDNIYFYVAKPAYLGATDTRQAFPEEYLLVDASQDISYDLGQAPKGDISQLTFIMGIDSASNTPQSSDPTTYPVGHPLGVQDPTMAWSWAAGYIFVRIDAQMDSDDDGVLDSPQVFHHGRQGNQRDIVLPLQATVDADNHTFVIQVDWEKFFTGLDPVTEGGHTIGAEYSDNFQSMFSVQ